MCSSDLGLKYLRIYDPKDEKERRKKDRQALNPLSGYLEFRKEMKRFLGITPKKTRKRERWLGTGGAELDT